ncbi:sensor histidine kinase [Jhaorihella thermophila]|uniref:histidine kinase n=1 Tax=Jhaorihella thermophila TaxID=488547 RepID=A0A1H5URG4_9RHOB|nr:HAMP domain-containing sensor histidine kinase [Jhaorihella thermophila]SEF77629.1 Signal transduction histidine kinase [Jhaorihella thermophila]
MAAARLWSSTPVRLSLALVALFAVMSFASLTATYFIIRQPLEQNLRDTLNQEMAGFGAVPSAAALAALVRSQSEVTEPHKRIISYRLPGGLVVGNAAILADHEGYRAVSLAPGGGDIHGEFYTLTRVLHGGLMTIAVSAEPVAQLRRIFTRVFLFSLFPTMLVALGGALLLARRSQRRIDRLERALDRLARGEFGARVGPIGGVRDDLSRIAERVDAMADELESKVAALRQVSADIAHDLKTPVQRLSVQLERLAATPGLPEPAAALAERARAEAQAMIRTFHALLQIAQIEGGQPRARFARVDLASLAATFCEVYDPSAEESGHRLIAVPAAGEVPVRGDKDLLGQILANLIENALRHTPAGTEIRVATGRDATGPWLEVSDTGPGIPESERDAVFRRLYRLESSRTTPGSGLGLSLVRAIADLHEARIELSDNRPGLRVMIHFPPVPTDH